MSRTSTRSDIRRRYLTLAVGLHPDKNPGSDGAEFKAINEAHDILSDTEKRKSYDDSNPHHGLGSRVCDAESMLNERERVVNSRRGSFLQRLRRILQSLNLEERKLQMDGIETIYFRRKSYFFISPCGSGKSLLFTVGPHLFPKKVTWVCTPSKELCDYMYQSVATAPGVKAILLTSDSSGHNEVASLDVRKSVMKGDINLVVSTPHQALNHKSFVLKLDESKMLTSFVIDEVDTVLCWSFMPEIRNLNKITKNLLNTPTVLLTATCPKIIRGLIKNIYSFKGRVVALPPTRKNKDIQTHVARYPSTDECCKCAAGIIKRFYGDKLDVDKGVSVIFCNSYDVCKDVFNAILAEYPETIDPALASFSSVDGKDGVITMSVPVVITNSLMPVTARKEAVHRLSTKTITVLIATTIAERGISMPGVKNVILVEVPLLFSSLLQRIGRVARKPGEMGFVYVLVSQIPMYKTLKVSSMETTDTVEIWKLQELIACTGFINTTTCLQDFIRRYGVSAYGATPSVTVSCGCCSSCTKAKIDWWKQDAQAHSEYITAFLGPSGYPYISVVRALKGKTHLGKYCKQKKKTDSFFKGFVGTMSKLNVKDIISVLMVLLYDFDLLKMVPNSTVMKTKPGGMSNVRKKKNILPIMAG